jgi:hypothetical protein
MSGPDHIRFFQQAISIQMDPDCKPGMLPRLTWFDQPDEGFGGQ